MLTEIETFELEGHDEAAVREEIIVPVLRLLGYRRGASATRISPPRNLQYVKLGREKRTISKLPDYVLDVDGRPTIIVEAKPPTDPVDFNAAQQCLSYAVHESVQALVGVVINGHELAVYRGSLHPSATEPVLRIPRVEWRSRWREIEKHLHPGSVRILRASTATDLLDLALPIAPSVQAIVRMERGEPPHVELHARDGRPLKVEIHARTSTAAAALAGVTDPTGPREVRIESADAVVMVGDDRVNLNEFWGPNLGPVVIQRVHVPREVDLYLLAPYGPQGVRIEGRIDTSEEDQLVLGDENLGLRMEVRRGAGVQMSFAPRRLPLLLGLRLLEFMQALENQGELTVVEADSMRVLLYGRGAFSAGVNPEFIEVLRKLTYASLRCRIHDLTTPEELTADQVQAIDAICRLLRGERVEHRTRVGPFPTEIVPLLGPGTEFVMDNHAIEVLGKQFVLGRARASITVVEEISTDGHLVVQGTILLDPEPIVRKNADDAPPSEPH